MASGSAIAGRNAVQDRCARPHHIEEAESISSQPVVNAVCHLEGVAGLIGRFNLETSSLHGEAGEVQNMNVPAGCCLWPYRPGPGESGVDDDPIPVADREGDRVLGIGYECRLFRSAGQVTQLVHPYLRTPTHNLGYLPLWPAHRCSLGAGSDDLAKPGQCARCGVEHRNVTLAREQPQFRCWTACCEPLTV
jgi:hypothetical protein